MKTAVTIMGYRLVVVFLLVQHLVSCGPESPPPKDSQIDVEDKMAEKSKPLIMIEDVDKNYLLGRFDPAQRSDFVEIDVQHTDRPGLLLHEEVYEAFLQMDSAARKEDITLVIRSATRNFEYQKGIWERKWKALDVEMPTPKDRALHILQWSSMPGTSRHHWGTDIDFNAFDNQYFEKGEGLKLYDWLVRHGDEYGFRQPYTAKDSLRTEGYNEEKWHWSYAPLAVPLIRMAEDSLIDEDIFDFLGAEQAPHIGVVDKYVLGVHPSLR